MNAHSHYTSIDCVMIEVVWYFVDYCNVISIFNNKRPLINSYSRTIASLHYFYATQSTCFYKLHNLHEILWSTCKELMLLPILMHEGCMHACLHTRSYDYSWAAHKTTGKLIIKVDSVPRSMNHSHFAYDPLIWNMSVTRSSILYNNLLIMGMLYADLFHYTTLLADNLCHA